MRFVVTQTYVHFVTDDEGSFGNNKNNSDMMTHVHKPSSVCKSHRHNLICLPDRTYEVILARITIMMCAFKKKAIPKVSVK